MTLDKVKLNSPRSRAWQKLMVSAINEMVRQGEPPLSTNGHHWGELRIDFQIEGLSVSAFLTDAGFDEVCVKVIVEPSATGSRCGFGAVMDRSSLHKMGRAYASGWFERRRGRWLQVSSHPHFYASKEIMGKLVAMEDPVPNGFSSTGPFIM